MSDLLSDAEAALLQAAVGVAPAIGTLIERAIAGDGAAVRRVREILPERGESAAAADELRVRS